MLFIYSILQNKHQKLRSQQVYKFFFQKHARKTNRKPTQKVQSFLLSFLALNFLPILLIFPPLREHVRLGFVQCGQRRSQGRVHAGPRGLWNVCLVQKMSSSFQQSVLLKGSLQPWNAAKLTPGAHTEPTFLAQRDLNSYIRLKINSWQSFKQKPSSSPSQS